VRLWDQPALAAGLPFRTAALQHPVDYGAVDAQPVDLIWALLSPETQGASHLKALAYVSRMLRKESLVQQLRGASNASTAYALVSEQLRQNAA
jgi:PTS system nitrogen regulatory IIA component